MCGLNVHNQTWRQDDALDDSVADPQRTRRDGRNGHDDSRLRDERRLRHDHRRPLDYDDSLVPGKIVASIMHLGKVTDKEDNELGLALRWSYGSVFGIWHGLLHRRLREPWASAIFGGTLMSPTLSLFPLLGRAPAPWRWPADVMPPRSLPMSRTWSPSRRSMTC